MSLLNENAKILSGMEKDGSDLGPSRRIDFAHVFPDRVSAEAFAAVATRDGFETAVQEVDRDESPWDVIALKDVVPSAENITSTEERLDRLARESGGLSDGWGFMRV